MSDQEKSAILSGIEMGIGTWSWGDRMIWNYGNGYDYEDIHQAFNSAVDFGFRFLILQRSMDREDRNPTWAISCKDPVTNWSSPVNSCLTHGDCLPDPLEKL